MRTVLVTGASDGIGRALVDHYHGDGWNVIAHGRRRREKIDPPLPSTVRYVREDLAARIERVVDAVPDRLDLAILNAGMGLVAPPAATSADEISQMVAVNTLAPLRLAHALHPRLDASGGRVVFVGSAAARGRHPQFAIYAATKAALTGAARALRLEWHGSVDVQIVHPGPTATAMHDKAGLDRSAMHRFFTPPGVVAEAIASTIASGRATKRFGLPFLLRHAVAASRSAASRSHARGAA